MCEVLLSSLLVLPCSHFFLLHVSPSASSAGLRVSSTLSSSQACSTALLAARQIRRRPRAVRMCGPLFTRIQDAFFHHVTCLFDTSFSSCIEFSFLASTHFSCVVTSCASSCPSWASNFSFFFSLLLSPRFFLSRLLRSPLFFSRLLRSLFFLFFLFVFFLL